MAAVKSAIIAERRSQKLQRLQAGQVKRRTAAEGLRESEDAVLRDIPAELHPIWNKVRGRIKGSSRRSRAEAFMQWVEENFGEVVALQQVKQERAMFKQSRMRKTKAEVAAELASVPF